MKEPSYENIIKAKIDYYGETRAAYQFAAEEYATERIKFDDWIRKKNPQLRHSFLIFFIDIDPDVGDISQITIVAYTEFEGYAKVLTDFLNSSEDGEECRTYKYIKM